MTELTGDRIEALTRYEKVGGRRLTKSWSDTPHFYIEREVSLEVVQGRRAIFASNSGGRPSLTAYVLEASARALQRNPRLNSRLDDGGRRLLGDIDIAVAVSTAQGLVTPVIRGVDRLGLEAIRDELRRLVDTSRVGRLRPADLAGATFTVTNLGAHGVDRFWPIINPPQASILAVGRARSIAAFIDGRLTERQVMSLVLAADHRVVDGAAAAAFLGDLAAGLEAVRSS